MAFIQISAGPHAGMTIQLDRPAVEIGRAVQGIALPNDQGVSRRHAAITCDGGQYVLQDLGSRNGTYVNGMRVTTHALRPGDMISVGGTLLAFGDGQQQVYQTVEMRAPSAGCPTPTPQVAPMPGYGYNVPSSADRLKDHALFCIIGFVLPVVGIILGVVGLTRPEVAWQNTGRAVIMWSLVGMGVGLALSMVSWIALGMLGGLGAF